MHGRLAVEGDVDSAFGIHAENPVELCRNGRECWCL